MDNDEKYENIKERIIPSKNYFIINGLNMRINKSYENLMKKPNHKEEATPVKSLFAIGVGMGTVTSIPYVLNMANASVLAFIDASNYGMSNYSNLQPMISEKINSITASLNNYANTSIALFAVSGSIVGVSLLPILKQKIASLIKREEKTVYCENIDSLIKGFVSIEDVKETVNDLTNSANDSGIKYVRNFLKTIDLTKTKKYTNEIFFKLIEIRKALREVELVQNRRPRTLEKKQNEAEIKIVDLCNIMYKLNYDPNISRDFKINEESINYMLRYSDINFTREFDNNRPSLDNDNYEQSQRFRR